jgi:hypothetical protein
MSQETYTNKKALLISLIFYGWYLLMIFLKYRVPMELFSNDEIDYKLLAKMNDIISISFVGLVGSAIYLLFLFLIFKKIPNLIRAHFLLPLIMILISDVLPGIELMLHSKHFFSFSKTTFSWNSVPEYYNYLHDYSYVRLIIYAVVLLLFLSYNFMQLKIWKNH